jgi:hypothetical protein
MAKTRIRDKYKSLFDVLQKYEKDNISFTKNILSKETGYAPGSIGVYIRNKLRNVYIFESQGNYFAKGIINIDYPSFAQYMSQKNYTVKGRKEPKYFEYRKKSIEAFYTAIANYNNPMNEYRIETFCILIANAWEILLKARLIETKGDTSIKRKDNKSISFLKSIEIVFPKAKNPVRKNLEVLNEIRDMAVHSIIPIQTSVFIRVFQSSIFNYIEALKEYKYPNPYADRMTGLFTLVSDAQSLDETTVPFILNDKSETAFANLVKKISILDKSTSDFRFAIPIEYKLVLTKKDAENDFKISVQKEGANVEGVIIAVPKDHNKTHPNISKDIINKVNEVFKKKVLNQYIFQQIVKYEGTKKSETEFYHRIEKPLTHTYSDSFVDFIVKKIKGNSTYIDKVRRYREK